MKLRIFALVVVIASAQAQDGGLQTTLKNDRLVSDVPAEGTLVAEAKSVERGGAIWVGLRVTMQPRWHIYWKNPGDSGLAPKLEWKLPDGVKVVTPPWPAPHRLWTDPLMMYGYSEEVLFPVKLEVPREFKPKTLKVELAASWLVCEDVCLTGRIKQSIEIPVRAGAPELDARRAPLFKSTREQTPKAVDNAFALAWTREELGLSIRTRLVPLNAESRAYFFPEHGGVLDHAADQKLTVNGKGALLSLTRDPTMKKDRIPHLRGVLVVQQGKQRRAYLVDVPAPKKK